VKKIIAVIRPEKLDDVRQALDELGCPGMMIEDIRGHGRQKGIELEWRVGTYKVDLLPKVKIQIVAKEEKVEPIIGAIVKSAATGEVGDGKIFIQSVEETVRIRTGERGEQAL